MFGAFRSARSTRTIDLASVRDTLLYIESDLEQAPDLQRLADAVRSALAEIDRIELSGQPAASPSIVDARFVPVGG